MPKATSNRKQQRRSPAIAGLGSVAPDVPILLKFESSKAVSGGARACSDPAEAAPAPDLFALAAASTEAGHGGGYDAWKREREEARRAFQAKWAVPLGCAVRVQISSQPRALEGVIRIIEEAAGAANSKQRFLRVGDVAFSPREVESVIRL